MTLGDIRNTINRSLSGNTTLTLDASAFGVETAIDQLIQDYFPEGKMIIMQASVSQTNRAVQVRGKTSLERIPLHDVDILASFQPEGSQVNLNLSFTLPASENTPWSFTSTFPHTADTVFNELAFSEAILLLDSHAGQAGHELEKGLNFEGVLHDWKPWPALQLLAVALGEMKVKGAIKMVRGLPEIKLTMPVGGLDLFFVKLFAEPEFVSEVLTSDPDEAEGGGSRIAPYLVSYSRLRSAISYTRQLNDRGQPIEFAGWVSVDGAQDKLVTLTADLSDFNAVNVQSLTKLAPGFDLSEILPAPLTRPGAFELNALCVTVNASQKRLEEISFGLSCNVKLSQVAEHFLPEGGSLPDGMPEVILTSFGLSVSPSSGAFSFSASALGSFEFPFTNTTANLDAVQFNVLRAPHTGEGQSRRPGPLSFSLDLAGATDLVITDGLSINDMEVSYAFDQVEGWRMSGMVGVSIIDQDLVLQVDLDAGERKVIAFQLEIPDGLEVLSLEEFGSLTLSRIRLEFSPGQTTGAGRNQADWILSGQGTVVIKDIFTATGSLELLNTAEKKGLVLDFDDAKGSFDIPLDPVNSDEKLTFGFNPESIEISRVVGAGWRFAASAEFSIDGLMQELDDVLPDSIRGFVEASSTSISFGIDPVLDDVEIPIPKIEVGDEALDLGKCFVSVRRLAVTIDRQRTGLSATARLGLPEKLNDIFGKDETRETRVRIFDAYDPDDPENSTIQFSFTAGTSGAMSLRWEKGSVFEAIKVENGVLKCDLGEFGAIDIDMPTFTYFSTRSGFEASGGFNIVRPLSVPLTPIKALLESADLDPAANLLPDSIPIKEIDFVDSQGNLNVSKFINSVEEGTGLTLPGWIKDAIEGAEDIVERLPQGFKDYLQVSIPQRLFFDVKFVRGGNVSFGLNTYDYDPTIEGDRERAKAAAEPLRMVSFGIIPGLMPLPGFNCIQLRRIAFGPLSGGSLFQMEIDAIWDQYDLASLAASLLLPEDKDFPLPTSDEIQQRMIFDDLFMIIIYQTVIPIPIPIFYEEAGLEYKGVPGVGLQGHLKFPQPKVGIKAIVDLFKQLKDFFSDADARLDPESPPGGVNLTFSMNDTYLELPEYLGGKKLGKGGEVFEIDAWENVAHLMNWMKKPSIGSLIQGIPLDQRVGTHRGTFYFFDYEVNWLLSTPEEFQRKAFARLQLDRDGRDDFMTVLPTVAPDGTSIRGSEEGIVTFLRGKIDIARAIELEAVFGLAASSASGFATGFQLTGSLQDILEMQIGGTVGLLPPGDSRSLPEFLLAGHGHFDVLGHRMLAAELLRTNDRFMFKGLLDLSPVDAVTVRGNVRCFINKTRFDLRGGVNVNLFGLKLLNADLLITNSTFKVTGSWLDILTTSLKISKANGHLTFDGLFKFGITLNFGAITKAAGLNLGTWNAVSVSISATLNISVSDTVSTAKIRGTFTIKGKSFRFNPPTLTLDTRMLGDFKGILKNYILGRAVELFEDVFDTAEKWIAAIKDGLVDFSDDVEKVAGVLQKQFDVGAKEAIILLDKAGYEAEKIAKALATVYKKTEEEIKELAEDLGEGFEALGQGLIDAADGLREFIGDVGDFFGL